MYNFSSFVEITLSLSQEWLSSLEKSSFFKTRVKLSVSLSHGFFDTFFYSLASISTPSSFLVGFFILGISFLCFFFRKKVRQLTTRWKEVGDAFFVLVLPFSMPTQFFKRGRKNWCMQWKNYPNIGTCALGYFRLFSNPKIKLTFYKNVVPSACLLFLVLKFRVLWTEFFCLMMPPASFKKVAKFFLVVGILKAKGHIFLLYKRLPEK